jgi:hypothetical protein
MVCDDEWKTERGTASHFFLKIGQLDYTRSGEAADTRDPQLHVKN